MIIFEYGDIFRLIKELNLLEDVIAASSKEFYETDFQIYLSNALREKLKNAALAGYTEKEIRDSGILDDIDTLTSPDSISGFSSINEFVFEYNIPDSEIPDSFKTLNLEKIGESFDSDLKFVEELFAIILSRNILDKLEGVLEIEGQAVEV